MATLEIKDDWNIAKGKLKQKWAMLANDGLEHAGGGSDEISDIYGSALAKPAKLS
jgi:hypothetical protein